ncbi:acyltransferase family protein [Bacteroides thetaiotaomicron]|uniref:acyltransferase family protein n=1 Tax=Bacteroides thetaiotaomicron TaxID=818 RepID=UPI001F353F9D|nr:acyltransferase [Bacteroides thetaiotaomicron]MCE8780666.1 acyltransferase [Bacteroides thetaiotaomicron]
MIQIYLQFYIVVISLIVLVLWGLNKKDDVTYGYGRTSLISSDVSVTLKAVCCILIILGHYALRNYDSSSLLVKALALGGGNVALAIFLFLSAYGVSQSDKKSPLNLTEYFRHRILKLLIPFCICSTLTVIFYWLLSTPVDEANLTAYSRLGTIYPAIANGKWDVSDFLLACIGIKQVNFAYWFVYITLFAYIVFFIVKKYIGLERKFACVSIYAVVLIIFGVIFGVQYFRNIWALILGLTVSVYEKDILKHPIRWVSIGFVLIAAYLFAYVVISRDGGIILIISNMLAMVILLCCGCIGRFYRLKQGSIIAILASISYPIYLIHGPFMHLQWSMTRNHKSLLSLIFVSVIVSLLINLFTSKIYSKVK